MEQDKIISFMPDFNLAAGAPAPRGVSFDGLVSSERKTQGEGALVIATVADREAFSAHNGKLHHEPHSIKSSGSLRHNVPACFAQFMPAISFMAAYEARHSPLFLYKQGFLTVRQWRVKEGACQNRMNWHVDERPRRQMMTGQFPLANHIYIVTDKSPTLVQARPLSHAFNALNEDILGGTRRNHVQMQPYDIALMTSLCYHRSAPAEESGIRTLLRVIYESPRRDVLNEVMASRQNKLEERLFHYTDERPAAGLKP